MTISLLDLVGRDVVMKRAGSTHGGEYAGPCPWCGGDDRFRVWPVHPVKPAFWCRQCGAEGDLVDYYARQHTGGDRRRALEDLKGQGFSPTWRQQTPVSPVAPASGFAEPVEPPSEAWQARGWEFVSYANAQLWAPGGADALAYLRRRGLTDDTIHRALLGYNPTPIHDRAEKWGLTADKPVTLAAGVVIPSWSAIAANIGAWSETLWGIRVRALAPRPDVPKYLGVRGYRPALYGADTISPDRTVVLVEGEIDALTIAQQVAEVAAVATGSTTACRRLRWVLLLARAPRVLVAYDGDDSGEKAAGYWLSALGDRATRWRAWWSDANALHQAGIDLRAWLAPALPA